MTFSRFVRRKRHHAEEVRRIYAIGDIHGRLDLFGALCRMIEADIADREPTSKVHMVLLGDLIDRGPDSRALVQLSMRLTAERGRITILKGNHEAALVEAWRGSFDALDLWLAHGGEATLRSYGVDTSTLDPDDSLLWMRATRGAIPRTHIEWMNGLPTWWAASGYYFAHAGIRPGVPLDAQRDDDRLWIREEFTTSKEDHGAIIVHGHSIEPEGVRMLPNRIGVDTGAYRTGVLSAIVLEESERRVIATSPASGSFNRRHGQSEAPAQS